MSKIALVQFKASTEKEKNLPKILDYIKQAAKNGADMCTFPEYMMFYTTSKQTARQVAQEAETINGEFVSAVAESAKNNSISIVGTMYEKSRKKDRVYDTSFIINNKGEVTGKYRKIHLYDALGFKESDKMSSGTEILVVPSAWVNGPMKEEHWLTLNKSRAIENGCYVIAPDHLGHVYSGRSLAVDPYGRILLDMKKRQGIGYVNISLDKVHEIRKKLPLLKNRRTDIYSDFKI